MPRPNPPTRALTVRQPWAWCITHDTKRVENRTWEPPRHWRGPLALHTAKTLNTAALASLQDDWGSAAPRREQLTLGAVVAVVRLVDVHPANRRTCMGNCLDWGAFPRGGQKPVWHWVITDVTLLRRPVPCTGALQLWTLPADVAAAAIAQTRRGPVWTA